MDWGLSRLRADPAEMAAELVGCDVARIDEVMPCAAAAIIHAAGRTAPSESEQSLTIC